MMLAKKLETKRFLLQSIDPTDDLTDYLSWMRDEASLPFIESVRVDYKLTSLKKYILEINSSKDSIQFGIFDKIKGNHVGNIKFYRIDFLNSECYVGFLIGDKRYQNIGAAPECFSVSSRYLRNSFSIRRFLLGVNSSNVPALRSYEKMGFVRISQKDDVLNMALSLDNQLDAGGF